MFTVRDVLINKGVVGADGRKHQRMGEGHDCSCCGTVDNGDDYFVFRAGWCDSDGVYYGKLCSDLEGNGCLHSVDCPNSLKNDAARMLNEMMPGELCDGVPGMLEDFEFIGEFNE